MIGESSAIDKVTTWAPSSLAFLVAATDSGVLPPKEAVITIV